jgi:hypothetical protein
MVRIRLIWRLLLGRWACGAARVVVVGCGNVAR